MEGSFAAGLVGVVLDGRYRLDALLGEGGMGAVFRAHHLAMDRRVAVKLLKPHLTTDDHALQRFAREARSTMKVDSPNAVKVLDFGVTPHHDYYMVLEYLDGRTVQRELDVDGPFAPPRVLHIARQALQALGAAHKSGLIHRDIKPDNILLMRSGDDPDFAKVLDFGVAKLMDGAASSSRSALAITQAGMVFGTPEFMSPEQACGQSLDPRSDLYSLAATMFAMLTGCGMYRAHTAIEWLTHHARTPPPHLIEGAPSLSIFPELDGVLQRCLAKQRADRPADADEMARLLASIEPTLSRRPGMSAERPTTPGRPQFSPSSYIEALPGETLVPQADATLPEAQAAAVQSMTRLPRQPAGASLPAGQSQPATTSGVIAQLTNRRGLYLALGAIAITGMIVAAIVAATRTHDRSPPAMVKHVDPADAALAPVRDAAVIAPVGSGSGGSANPPEAASGGSGAGSGHGPGSGSGVRPSMLRTSAELASHLAAAEDARRGQNRLRELSEADAAHQLDPRNARARFLLGDALVSTGDLDRGCKYLRDLGKSPEALARARQAGCPTD